ASSAAALTSGASSRRLLLLSGRSLRDDCGGSYETANGVNCCSVHAKTFLSLTQTRERSGAVSERLILQAHAMRHCKVEIAERRFFGEAEASTWLQRAFAFSGERDGKVMLKVKVAALDAVPE